jgi:peptidoglycan/LPS O-acetylase OafA/YrhL
MGAGFEVTTQPSFAHHRSLDGLRGLAVGAVVLYHFAPGFLPGGFLGVDVFFVLSGFLITSLLLAEFAAEGSVSLRGFWSRRLRRLLPASLAVIAVSVVLFWWLESSSARPALRTQSLSSLFYVNNWSAITSGTSYESRFGEELPLTHFWSLAIEEQFYLLFPVAILAVVMVLRRRGRRTPHALARPVLIASSITALTSAALMAVLHQPHVDPSRVYFGSDTRLHAILIGVALACLNQLRPTRPDRHPRTVPELLALASLLMLIAAFRFAGFRQDWLYNGGFLGISILTAALIWILVRESPTPLGFLLHHRWIVGLGLVSYGVYLWHWPARVFLTEDRTGLDGFPLFAVRVMVTAIATAISYRLIEKPFRGGAAVRTRRPIMSGRQFAVAGAAMASVAVLCVSLTIPETEPGSVPVAAPPPVETRLGAPVRVYLVGDSVAWTLAGGRFAFPQPTSTVSSLDPEEVTLWNRSRFGLSLLRWPKRTDTTESNDCPSCEPVIDWSADIERFRPDLVVHSAMLFDTYDIRIDDEWITFGSEQFDTLYLNALDGLRMKIRAFGSRLVLMTQPLPGTYPDEWSEQFSRDSRTFPHINELKRRFVAQHPDVSLVDLDSEFCPQQRCILTDASGHELRSDGLHFTASGAAHVAPWLTEQFRSIVISPTEATRSAQDG